MSNFYRAEIDGLRTVAILPVIFFHAGFNWVSGGFIGVDIFFVISGYLITFLLIQEHANTGKISIYNFYERRLRRILPALFTVLVPSSIFSYFILQPELSLSYVKGLAYTLIFSSNIYFWKTSGYFDVEAENHPLLHTWSLAVEEQFYIFFPLLLIAFYKMFKKERRNLLILLIISIGLISLIASEKTLQTNKVSAFYLLPFRAWELMVGAICATSYIKFTAYISNDTRRIIYAEIISLLGLIFIFSSILTLNEYSPFPGINAVPAVLGAALIISFSKGTITSKLLSYKPFVWIGLISYSLYLWHQPIFAFARIMSINELDQKIYILLIAITFILATLSYFLVEQPFRKKQKVSYKTFITVFVTITLLLLAYISSSVISDGFKSRHSKALLANTFERHPTPEKDVCNKNYILPGVANVDICEFGAEASKSTLVLLGDSHATMLLKPLHTALIKNNMKGYRILNWNCNVIPGFFKSSEREHLNKLANCNTSQTKVHDFIKSKNAITLLSVRWTNRVAPIDGYNASVLFDNSQGGVERSNTGHPNFVMHQGHKSLNASAKKEVIEQYINTLISVSTKLIIIGPVPEVGWNVTDYNHLYHFYNDAIPDEITTSYDLYLNRHKFITDILLPFQSKGKVSFINSADCFCISENKTCYAQKNGVSYYTDDDHLNERGSAILINKVKELDSKLY